MFLKYCFDRIISLVGLLLCLFPFLIIGILIKWKMPGPVLFKQVRIGKNGKPFVLFKFRTMKEEHHFSTVSVYGEDRITPLGQFLRRYKLDELPELWNVFIGDMSFVGPRPDVPGYADLLKGEDRIILSVRPGITGPASLKYRNEEILLSKQTDPQEYNDRVIYPDKVRINKYYINNWSFYLDLKLIYWTLVPFNSSQYRYIYG